MGLVHDDTSDTRVTGLRLEGHLRKCVCKAVAEFAADDDLVVGGTIRTAIWKAVSSQFSNRVLVPRLPDPLGDSPDGRQRHPGQDHQHETS